MASVVADRSVRSRREGELPGSGSETTSREAGITENETVNNKEETKRKKKVKLNITMKRKHSRLSV